ncbi:hypothetical protein [Bacteroidetes bacterium endosymbiont of Geopemphigus sp.]|uniref:hypothetical protein n=1 Tax=Bacteroidetes bacterium endosymbiont of Geopemphigus sp. TaxID=2047937 RepID=UPI000CD03EB5|nr:hypothetical protein [Bacteroidetes bacterium endosymbiont of Geopemphigus sp.]
MTHRLSIKEVKNVLSELKKEVERNSLRFIASMEEKLMQEMINNLDPVIKPVIPKENSQEALLKNPSEKEIGNGNYPLLHNNMYGRLFESKVAEELMKNPPREVKKTMETIGKRFYKVK